MNAEQVAIVERAENTRFRAMVATDGRIGAIEVYSRDEVAAGVARMWLDLSMVKACWRVLDQIKKAGRVYLSASPDTLNLAGGKYVRFLAGLAAEGVEVNVMLGQCAGIYDPQKLLQFVTATKPLGIRLGVAFHSRAWDTIGMARSVRAAFVTVDEREAVALAGFDEEVSSALRGVEFIGVGLASKHALRVMERLGATWCSGPAARAGRRADPPQRGMKTLLVTAVAGTVLAACASAPVPVVPDGSRRVQVNDPQRIQQLKVATTEQNVAVSERSQLMGEVNMMRRQISDLQTAIKVLLTTPADPPAAPAGPAAAAAPSAAPASKPPAAAPATPAKPAPAQLKDQVVPPILPPADGGKQNARAVEQDERGVVFRVFHASGEAKFSPAGDLADELVSAAKKGQAIEVHGRTDSRKPTEGNTRVAIARAVEARKWLVNQGIEAGRVRARYSSAGNFLVDADTEDAKAMNRRVEIVIRAEQPKTAATKSNKQGA